MTGKSPKEVVVGFWEAMETNDFAHASNFLALDFECFWPQSGERIVGREDFERINTTYPASGTWRFKTNAIVCEGEVVVTDVSVTDGSISARAITFSMVKNGLISRQTEFWPDDFEAPEWRRQWVQIES